MLKLTLDETAKQRARAAAASIAGAFGWLFEDIPR